MKGRGTIFLGGPAAGEGGHRRGGERGGAGRAPTCTRASAAWPTTSRRTTSTPSRWARDIVGGLTARKEAALGRARSRRTRATTRARSGGIVPGEHPQGLRRARGDRAHRGRQPVPGVQGPLRTHPRHRLRAHHGLPGGDPRQQRRAVLGERAQGHALHRDVLPAARSPSCSCRTSPASSWARSTSRRASPRTGPRWSTRWPTPQVPKFTVIIGRQLRGRELRHVRPRLPAAPALDVAERAHLGDGRASRRRPCWPR